MLVWLNAVQYPYGTFWLNETRNNHQLPVLILGFTDFYNTYHRRAYVLQSKELIDSLVPDPFRMIPWIPFNVYNLQAKKKATVFVLPTDEVDSSSNDDFEWFYEYNHISVPFYREFKLPPRKT